MKILVAHNYYRQPGGEDEVFDTETRLLESKGHDVTRFVMRNSDASNHGPLRFARNAVWNREVGKSFRRLVRHEKPDVLHVHNAFHLMSPAIFRAAASEGIPVVQTLHNYRLLCCNAMLYRSGHICEECVGRRIGWPGILHRCYRGGVASVGAVAVATIHRTLAVQCESIDLLIAPSEFLRAKLVAGGIPARKLVVKPNFVWPDPGPGGGDGNFALFVGRLATEKGISTLLRAFRSLGGRIPLRVVGDGPAQDASRSSEHPGVTFLGRCSREEVHDLMGAARCLIVPSEWYEVCPMVTLEALAKGTPLIVAGHGALATIVDHGRTGLHFVPGDSEDLARQVTRMFDGSLKLEAMRASARSAFEASFTAEVGYEALIGIYERLVSSKPRLNRSSTH